jgi:hypothetical protein
MVGPMQAVGYLGSVAFSAHPACGSTGLPNDESHGVPSGMAVVATTGFTDSESCYHAATTSPQSRGIHEHLHLVGILVFPWFWTLLGAVSCVNISTNEVTGDRTTAGGVGDLLNPAPPGPASRTRSGRTISSGRALRFRVGKKEWERRKSAFSSSNDLAPTWIELKLLAQ